MSFKIVPWLLVLSITLAYAFPAEQTNDEDDPNHVHDDKCTHPIKTAYNKVKESVSNAYQKTKETIGNAYQSVKNKFKKPETPATEKPQNPPPFSGREGTDSPTGTDSAQNNGDSSNQWTPSPVDGGAGNSNIGSSDNTDASISNNNGGSTSNDQQRPPTDSEVEGIINVRFQNNKPRV